MIIYKITNKINGKVYVGQTTRTLEERYRGHLSRAERGDKGHLYPAMRKYGYNNFKCEIIEEIDDTLPNANQLLNEREIYWIKYYDSTNNKKGYNITLGGDINRMYCPVSRKHHADRMKTKETRQNISAGRKKYIEEHGFSEEHRKHLSEALKGNHNWGTGDTRSIACYCILDTGERFDFHSYRDAGIWWYNTYKPFGDIKYAECTFQRKIKASINGEQISYTITKPNRKKIIITNIKWYRGGDAK